MSRGLLDGHELTGAGTALKEHIESRTDDLAAVPLAALSDDDREELFGRLAPVAQSVIASGVLG